MMTSLKIVLVASFGSFKYLAMMVPYPWLPTPYPPLVYPPTDISVHFYVSPLFICLPMVCSWFYPTMLCLVGFGSSV